MRALAAMMLLSSLAHAQAFDPCQRYADQEEQAAHEHCAAEWRMLLPRAEEELGRPPPERVSDCRKQYASWEAAAQTDPNDLDAMSHRISARETVEWCNRSWHFEHVPQAEKNRRNAPGLIVAGGIMLGVGGAGLTALGGVGAYLLTLPPPPHGGNPVGDVILASMGGFTGAIAIVGALLLGLGARYRR